MWAAKDPLPSIIEANARLTKFYREKRDEETWKPQKTDLKAQEKYAKSFKAPDLHLAVLNNDLPLVADLLKQGADPNERLTGTSGCPALFCCKSYEALELLLKHGADPSLRSGNGDVYLKYVARGNSHMARADEMRAVKLLQAVGSQLGNLELERLCRDIVDLDILSDTTRYVIKQAALKLWTFIFREEQQLEEEEEEEEVNSESETAPPVEKRPLDKTPGSTAMEYYLSCVDEVNVMKRLYYGEHSLRDILRSIEARELAIIARDLETRKALGKLLFEDHIEELDLTTYIEEIQSLVMDALEIEAYERILAGRMAEDKEIRISGGISIDVLSLLTKEELHLVNRSFERMGLVHQMDDYVTRKVRPLKRQLILNRQEKIIKITFVRKPRVDKYK